MRTSAREENEQFHRHLPLNLLFIYGDTSMSMLLTIPPGYVAEPLNEELTKTDKSDIKKMISDELDKVLKKELKKALEDELPKALSSTTSKEEIGKITKKVLKRLYKDLSLHHPYIIDRIKI